MVDFFRIAGLTAIAVLFAALGGSAQNGEATLDGFDPSRAHYLWPTEASSYLSSTFGETRSAHFHAALDIKTWGQKGYRVFATRDGVLSRIGIGPGGYGKVLYLKHGDGSYSVYAHLLAFSEPIRHLADSLRLPTYSFELDRVVEGLGITVEQGEVIGYSGATGIGPPHLHFELRTPANRPFNPLLTNLRVPDSVPPQFSRLSVEPLSIGTEIEGENRVYTKRAYRSGGHYSFGTIDVTGPVGLGVDVFDQANRVNNAYAVYRLELFVNGRRRFASTVNSFSYGETGQMFLDRVYPILLNTGEGFQRLYRAEGNSLPFYKEERGGGRLELPAGTHRIRIVAYDYFGNTSEAQGTLHVRPRPGPRAEGPRAEKSARPAPAGSTDFTNGRRPDPSNWDWYADWLTLETDAFNRTIVIPRDSPDNRLVTIPGNPQTRVDITTAESFYINTGDGYFTLRRLFPERFHILKGDPGEAYALFESGTFYDTLSVGMQSRWLAPDSARIDLYPYNQPLQKEFTLGIALDSMQAAKGKWGLYRLDLRKNKLEYLATRTRGAYAWSGEAGALGRYYALRDTTAPVPENPRLTRREDGRWVVAVSLDDNLSGIDHARSVFYINGIRGIAEYEPEDDRIVYYHPDFQPIEENRIELTVFDRMGNKAERAFTIKK